MKTTFNLHRRREQALVLAIVLALLLVVYIPTLQTNINGSSDDLMNDVGEVQVVLNTWGTLHATGYPLFVILGNLFVSAMRAVGMAPIIAPTLFSLLWGLAALVCIFVFAVQQTGRTELAAMATLLYGLTYYTWLYNVVAAVRSMGLLLEVLLLILALRKPPVPHRLLWLALIGGIGIAHHRAFIFFVPAIVFAAWQEFYAAFRRNPFILVPLVLAGLAGFLPYAYLPWRANAGATWVYGTPNTFEGFLDQFMGHEASQMFGLNTSVDLIGELFRQHLDLVTKQVTIPGILVGLLGLVWGMRSPKLRRSAITLVLISLVPFAFDMFGTQDHLPPFIMTFALSLVFGWIFLLDRLLDVARAGRYIRLSLLPLTLAVGLGFIGLNFIVISDMTHDPTGIETIEFAKTVPAGATLMLDWGARYFAIGFAQDVLGGLVEIHRVDHRGDFAAIVPHGMLVTPDYTFYEHPLRWWRDKLEKKPYLRAVAPHLIQIDVAPWIEPVSGNALSADYDPSVPVMPQSQSLQCSSNGLVLKVDWWALRKPARDLAVFVHLTDADGRVLAQSDQSAPVYGWRPLTSWEPGEIVRDVYPLPRAENATTLQYGFYEKLSNGEFKNYAVVTTPLSCSAFP